MFGETNCTVPGFALLIPSFLFPFPYAALAIPTQVRVELILLIVGYVFEVTFLSSFIHSFPPFRFILLPYYTLVVFKDCGV
ncbi:hypothetical protein HOY82DRAFT_552669 [Tuber indicum]|nr:hypothetical protein HOY82DRAFT_552669 [Tuber indicum]